jgi:hypothetical protein
MAKKLIANVYVDGTLYGPDGEEPSKEVAEQISNPAAWGEDEESKPAAKGSAKSGS